MTRRAIRSTICLSAACLLASSLARPASAQNVQLTVVVTGPNSGAVGTSLGLCNSPGFGAPDQTCVFSAPAGTTVVVRGNAPLGSAAGLIAASSGSAAACTLNTSTCSFAIAADSSLTMVFDQANSALFRTMTVGIAGEGDGEVGADNNRCQTFDPLQSSACATSYGAGSVVTLNARDLAGSRFLQFSNGTEQAAACTSSPCSFVIDNPTSVTANFGRLTALAVNPPGATVGIGQSQNFSATGTFVNGADVSSAPVQGNQGTWKFRAPMGTARFALAAAALNGRVYAVGGVEGTPGGGPLTLVEAYDPSSNTWSSRAPLPLGREGHGAAVAGGELYAISGNAPGGTIVDRVDAYDPASNSWSPRAPILTARRSFGVGVLNGLIYVVGGEDPSGVMLATVEAYDPATDTWTTKAPMPTARGWLAAAVVDGILYAVGGRSATSGSLSTVEAYDPATNTWSARAALPSPRASHAAASVDGVLYIVGGSSNGFLQSGVFAFDPAGNSWNFKSSMPQELVGSFFASTASGQLGAAALDGVVYAVGGQAMRGFPMAPTAIATAAAFTDHLVWGTSHPGVASIRQFGQATGIAAGTTTITARTGVVSCLATAGCGTLLVGDPPTGGAPVAQDDFATTFRNLPVAVPVLRNDSDPDGDPLRITAVSDPSNGIAFRLFGLIVYVPARGFTGVDTFTYTVRDPDGGTDTATVTVTVRRHRRDTDRH